MNRNGSCFEHCHLGRWTRNAIERDGVRLAVDELDDGTFLAEIDDGETAALQSPKLAERSQGGHGRRGVDRSRPGELNVGGPNLL